MSVKCLRPEEWLLWNVKEEHLAHVFWYEMARQQVRNIQAGSYAGKPLPEWYVTYKQDQGSIRELSFPRNYHPSEKSSKTPFQEIRRAFRFGYRLRVPEGFPEVSILTSGLSPIQRHSTPIERLIAGDFIKLPGLPEETRELIGEIRSISEELEKALTVVETGSKSVRVEAEICFNTPNKEIIREFSEFLSSPSFREGGEKRETRGGSRYRGKRKCSDVSPEAYFNLKETYPTPILRSRETKAFWRVENWQLEVPLQEPVATTLEQFEKLLKQRRTQEHEKSTGLSRRVTDFLRSSLKDLGSLRVQEAREGSADWAIEFMEQFGEEHGLGEYGFRRQPSQFSRGRKQLESIEAILFF